MNDFVQRQESGRISYIVSIQPILEIIEPYLYLLRNLGIEQYNVMWYVLHQVRHGDPKDFMIKLTKDILTSLPELRTNYPNLEKYRKETLLIFEEITSKTIPYFERVCGRCDHTLTFRKLDEFTLLINFK